MMGNEKIGLGVLAFVLFIIAIYVSQVKGEPFVIFAVVLGCIVGMILSIIALAKS